MDYDWLREWTENCSTSTDKLWKCDVKSTFWKVFSFSFSFKSSKVTVHTHCHSPTPTMYNTIDDIKPYLDVVQAGLKITGLPKLKSSHVFWDWISTF